jgi:hypothetical protein
MNKVDLKTVYPLEKPPVEKCPYCGSEEFYINERVSGCIEYHYRFDGDEGENGELHEPLNYTDTGKFAYCSCCRKRVFRYRNLDLTMEKEKLYERARSNRITKRYAKSITGLCRYDWCSGFCVWA